MLALKRRRQKNGEFKDSLGQLHWLMPEILATQEAEIRKIEVQSQPGPTVCETLS
jgi:hypothetical protein